MAASRRPAQACIFDLDGTLVDSLADIAGALNECLELLGIEPRPLSEYRYMVGEGMPVLCQRAIGDTHPRLTERLTELARARYFVRPLRHTRPYPGVCELIERLHERGVKLAVLSNKPHDATVRVVQTFWPNGQFACVQGYVAEHSRKPDPFHALRICKSLGVPPAQTWLIGDTPTDVRTAERCGAVSVGVTWGFRTRTDLESAGAHYVFDHPDELA